MVQGKIVIIILFLFSSLLGFSQFQNNAYRIVNGKIYGAPMDANFVYDAAITGTTVTSATANFKSSDVGKICEYYGSATSNGAQIGTITGFTNSTTITVSFTTAVGAVSGNKFIYGSDCTAGLQRMLLVADSLGIHDCYISGKGILAGALVTSDNNGKNPNCQIYIPTQQKSGKQHHGSIWLHGDGSNGQYFNYFGSGIGATAQDGTVLVSTLSSSSGTAPGIFGTIGDDGGFNADVISFSDLTIEAYTNNGKSSPVLTPMSLANASTIQAYNVAVKLDVDLTASSAPGEVAGWIVGQLNNNGPNILEGCTTWGFKYGFMVSEHTQILSSLVFGAVYGFVIQPGNFAVTGVMETAGCNWSIWFQDTTKMGITTPNSLNPSNQFPINVTLNNEVDSGAGFSPTYWFFTKGQVLDPHGYGTGLIAIQSIHGVSGISENQNIVTVGVNTAKLWIYPLNSGLPVPGAVGGNNAIEYDSSGLISGNNGAFGYNYSTGLVYNGGWQNTTDALDVVKSQNSQLSMYFKNTLNTASNSASTFLGVLESAATNQVAFWQLNSNKSAGSGLFSVGSGGIYAIEPNLVINNQKASTGTIDMGNGTGTTPQLRIQNNGDITIGTGTDNSTALVQILGTGNQLSLLHDASNHVELFAGSGGGFNVVPSNGSGFITGHWEPAATTTYDLGQSANVWRALYIQHVIGGGGTPSTSTLGTNVTSATAAGTDNDFQITVVASGAVSGTICTVTYATGWGAKPHVVFSINDATTAAASSAMFAGTSSSTTQFTFGGTISGAGTYIYNFHAAQ